MEARSLDIEGAWRFSPVIHHDHRGGFLEIFTNASLEHVTGRQLHVAQINISFSRRGVIRGIHAASDPPGQAKHVMCVVGEILDVVVDLRQESPTFGRWASAILDGKSWDSVFISEGLGHAFQVLSTTATVLYATSTPYDPQSEFAIDPMDPDLAISWKSLGAVILSDRDRNAPRFKDHVDGTLNGSDRD